MIRFGLMGAVALAAVATSASAMPPMGSPAPFSSEATVLVLEPRDGAAHYCRMPYLLFLQATTDVDNATVAVTLINRKGEELKPGNWLSVSGFKITRPVDARVKVSMICG